MARHAIVDLPEVDLRLRFELDVSFKGLDTGMLERETSITYPARQFDRR
jgi:hypothetical protein